MARKPASGLPVWRKAPDGGWMCNDPTEMRFALRAVITGLDIRLFDNWLRRLEPCPAREQLLALRAKAKAAASPDVMRPYFEAMLVRRTFIEREEVVLPLARHGRTMSGGRKKGSRNTINEAIAAYMADNPHAPALEVWNALSQMKKLTKAYDFRSNSIGRYIEVGAETVMQWKRFENVVSETRPKAAKRRRK